MEPSIENLFDFSTLVGSSSNAQPPRELNQ